MQITAQIIADILDGEVVGDPMATISGPGKIEEASQGMITFLANPKYKEYIYSTNASVVLVESDFIPEKPVNPTLIKVKNVYASLAILMEKFNSGMSVQTGVASTAVMDSSARIGTDVSIDDYVIVKKNVVIGDGTTVFGQVFIGDNVTIGRHCILYPGVKIYHNCIIGDRCIIQANSVIGSDGFGFVKDENGQYKKIPQTGNVVIEDDVEIGSNTVIDRASMGSTVIKKGAKLDNLIQIAHNVSIGSHTVMAAQSGVAGSTQMGENCMIGGQVGVAGHLKIANGAMVQAQSGIASAIKNEGAKLFGSPAIDYHQYLKSYAYFKKLPELMQELKDLRLKMTKINTD